MIACGKKVPQCYRLVLATALVFAASNGAGAATYRVIGVADGDTLTILDELKTPITCRLYGIDAPEKSQAFGAKSKASLADMAFQKDAEVAMVGRDRYGRSICKVSVGGLDLNQQQVARGMAWVYRRYTADPRYYAAEGAARAAAHGLWRDPSPVPPWDYRRRK